MLNKLTIVPSNNSKVLSPKTTNKRDSQKLVSICCGTSLLGSGCGFIYYNVKNLPSYSKQKVNIINKYNNIIEDKLKEHIDNALKIDNEVMSQQSIDFLRGIFRKRQQKNIDSELIPLKKQAKQCIKKNVGFGLLIGFALGVLYILSQVQMNNKKEK